MSDKENYQYIELYLSGELHGEDLRRFEHLLQDDEEFAREVQMCNQLMQAIEDYGIEQQVKTVHQQMMKEYYRTQSARTWSMLVMPLFLLFASLAAACIWLYTPATRLYTETIQRVDLEYTQPYPCGASNRSSGIALDPIMTAYITCDYQKCIEIYEKTHPHSVEATFYAGNAYLVNSRYSEARECFNRVSVMTATTPESRFRELAAWYNIIVEMQTGNPAPAEATLKKVTSTRAEYRYLQTLQYYLLLNYLKNENADAADRVLSGMDEEFKFRAQVKLLKWKQEVL